MTGHPESALWATPARAPGSGRDARRPCARFYLCRLLRRFNLAEAARCIETAHFLRRTDLDRGFQQANPLKARPENKPSQFSQTSPPSHSGPTY